MLAGATHTPRAFSRAAIVPVAAPSGGRARNGASWGVVGSTTWTQGCHTAAKLSGEPLMRLSLVSRCDQARKSAVP